MSTEFKTLFGSTIRLRRAQDKKLSRREARTLGLPAAVGTGRYGVPGRSSGKGAGYGRGSESQIKSWATSVWTPCDGDQGRQGRGAGRSATTRAVDEQLEATIDWEDALSSLYRGILKRSMTPQCCAAYARLDVIEPAVLHRGEQGVDTLSEGDQLELSCARLRAKDFSDKTSGETLLAYLKKYEMVDSLTPERVQAMKLFKKIEGPRDIAQERWVKNATLVISMIKPYLNTLKMETLPPPNARHEKQR